MFFGETDSEVEAQISCPSKEKRGEEKTLMFEKKKTGMAEEEINNWFKITEQAHG